MCACVLSPDLTSIMQAFKKKKKKRKKGKCIDVKSAKGSRSLQVLILLRCERTENQFKEEHVGARLAFFTCRPGCVSRGEACVVGLEMGKIRWQCSSGMGGGNSTSNTEAAERQKGCWKVNFLSRIRAEIAGLSCLSEADRRNSHRNPEVNLCCAFCLWFVRGAIENRTKLSFLMHYQSPPEQ